MWRVRALRCFESPRTAFGSGSHLLFEDQCSLCSLCSLCCFARFCQFCSDARSSLARARKCAASFHACVSYVFNGTLARRKKTVLSKLAIKLRVRHATPHLNTTRRPLAPGKNRPLCHGPYMSCMAKLRWLRQKLLCGPRLHHCTRIVGVRPCRNEPYCGARECNHASRVSNFAQTPDAERRNSISNRYAIARRSVFNSTR